MMIVAAPDGKMKGKGGEKGKKKKEGGGKKKNEDRKSDLER